MHADDALTDRLLAVYHRCRTSSARASALAELVSAADPFIKRVVRHWSKGALRDLDPEEALQAGRMGYLEAVRRLDPSKGPLRPYAILRIRHELQTLAESSYTIKIPRRSGLPASLMRQAEVTWAREGRELSAQELNGHAPAWEAAAQRPRVVTSFDAPKGLGDAEGARSLHDTIACESPDALSQLIEADRNESGVRARLTEIAETAPQGRRPMSDTLPDNVTRLPAPEIESMNAAMQPLLEHLRAREDRKAALRRELAALEAADRHLAAALGKSITKLGTASTAAATAAPRGRPPRAESKADAEPLPVRVLESLRDRPRQKVKDLSRRVGAKTASVSMALARLKAKGKVTKEGDGRETVYSAAS